MENPVKKAKLEERLEKKKKFYQDYLELERLENRKKFYQDYLEKKRKSLEIKSLRNRILGIGSHTDYKK